MNRMLQVFLFTSAHPRYIFLIQVMASKCLNEMIQVFQEDDSKNLLVECGFLNPVNSFDLKPVIISTLLDYHLMLKVKAAMDQFIEGLENPGTLKEIRKSPSLFQHYFLHTKKIDAGIKNKIV